MASSRVSADGTQTHHVLASGAPLYPSGRFAEVLPFHPPGLAPARLRSPAGRWTHVDGLGRLAYAHTFARAFGFYEGLAAVELAPSVAAFVRPDGGPAHGGGARVLSWAGNFCGGRAAMCAGAGPARRYAHVALDGGALPNAPPGGYAYCGDFREGLAVARDTDTGLARPMVPRCHWVEECGAPRPAAPRPLFDLEPPHKGLARARDADGWFPLRATRGATTPPPSPSSACEEELYPGARFSSLEPFYNGTALAVRSGTGERVLLRDDGGGGGCCVAEPLGGAARDVAPAEHAAALHGLCVSPWPGLALRAGLAAGLAGEGVRGALLRLAPAAAAATARQPPPVVADALARAWRSMGLLERDSDDGGADVGGCGAPPALSPRGLLLAQPGGAAQAKAAFWLGDAVVGAWAAGAALPQAAPACGDPPPASPASASSALVPLFSDPAVQAALDAHADDDGWGDPSGLAAALWRLASPPPGCGGLRDSSPPPQQPLPDAAVDVGGGLGRLAAALKAARPGADVVLAELPAVAALAAGRCAAAGVAVAAANLLAPSPPPSPPLPPARLFVLVRVLHDHRDAPALALLRAVRTCAPAGALLAVVERGTGRGGGCDGAGLLSLHLALMRGTVERGGGEWRRLLGAAVPGWRLQGGGPVPFGGQDTWLLRAS